MGISDYQLLELIYKNIDLNSLKTQEPSLTQERLESLFEGLKAILHRQKSKAGRLLIYTDGASRGNPGKSGIGVVICDKKHNVIEEVSRYIGETTNNVAEYKALIAGLERVLEYGPKEVGILSDSELLVKQLRGEYGVKAKAILPHFREAKRLLDMLPKWSVRHIPREQNPRADALANLAIDSHDAS